MSSREDASSHSQRSEPPVRKVNISWPRLERYMVEERRPQPPEVRKGARALEQEGWKVERVTRLLPHGGCGLVLPSPGTEVMEAGKSSELVPGPLAESPSKLISMGGFGRADQCQQTRKQ